MSDMNKRLERIHTALSETSTNDLSNIKSSIYGNHGFHHVSIDFNQGASEAELENMAFTLISNIASIKDHFKVWCKTKDVKFEGENLINNCLAVSLIHDLWNIDKHAELSAAPRSGHHPKLQGIRKVLVVSSGTAEGSGAAFSINSSTGQMESSTFGGGALTHRLSAKIINEHGTILGDFFQTCQEAIEEWSKTLIKAGVPLP